MEPTRAGPDGRLAETLLATYVEQALQRVADDQPLDLDDLCREHPWLAQPVAEALALRDGLSHLHDQAEQRDPHVGDVLASRYRLDARLGAGAMGIVYRGTDLSLQRLVAVKLLQDRLAGDPSPEQRFAREAQALAALQHPNVVPIHDRGTTEQGTAFLVMALLDGLPLDRVLAAAQQRLAPPANVHGDLAFLAEMLGTAPPERGWVRLSARIGQRLADALAAAHAADVLHRDVKPSNVFLMRSYEPMLLDFGLARRARDAALTAADSTIGTPSYMAPEQASGGSVGPAADIYGLGATLYHLLALQPPFEGPVLRILTKVRTVDPPQLRRLSPGVPVDLVAIVEKSMEKDPARRYPTMAAFAADLQAFLDQRAVSARPISWFGRLTRKAKRSPARAAAGLSTAAAIMLAAFVVPLEAAARERARQDEKAALAATLPAHIAIEGDPEHPSAQEIGERDENLALVDRMLQLDANDLPLRLIRAGLRLDRGEHEAATADVVHLAQQQASPYMHAVAERYRAAIASVRGIRSVKLDDLGAAPASPQEHFVAGFHALRSRRAVGFAQAATQELDQAAADYLPARDLRLIAWAELGVARELAGDRPAAQEWFRRVLAEAYTLEGIYGRRTARTRFAIGTAHVSLGHYRDAIAPLEESLALRPARHGPWQNLANARQRLGDLEGAAECLRQAEAIRPGMFNTRWTLAVLAKDARDWAQARDWAARLPADAIQARPWLVPQLLGDIALQEEMAAASAADPATVQELAKVAIEHFDAGLRALEPFPSEKSAAAILTVNRQVAVAIAAGNRDQACRDLIRLLGGGAPRPYALRVLAELLPSDGLGAESIEMLRQFLQALARWSAPDDRTLDK